MKMELIQLVKRDIILVYSRLNKRILLLTLFLFLFITKDALDIGRNGNIFTLLIYAFQGLDYEIIKSGDKVNIPIDWLFIQFCGAFIIGDFLQSDLYNSSSFLLIRLRKKSNYLISKFIICFILSLFVYILTILITFIVGYIYFSGPIALSNLNINIKGIEMPFSFWKMLICLFSGTFLISSLQIVLTLFTNSIYAFIINLIWLIGSIGTINKYFIGNNTMIIRHSPFQEGSAIDMKWSLLFFSVTLILILTAGLFKFKKIQVLTSTQGD